MKILPKVYQAQYTYWRIAENPRRYRKCNTRSAWVVARTLKNATTDLKKVEREYGGKRKYSLQIMETSYFGHLAILFIPGYHRKIKGKWVQVI